MVSVGKSTHIFYLSKSSNNTQLQVKVLFIKLYLSLTIKVISVKCTQYQKKNYLLGRMPSFRVLFYKFIMCFKVTSNYNSEINVVK